MADQFRDYLEVALSSYSMHNTDDYEDEEEDDYEGDDSLNQGKSEELACPFCTEDFDVLGLCCHIDADHRMEVKHGICPVCGVKVVGGSMASHVITQHDSILKTLSNRKYHSTRSRSTILLLRKELLEKHFRIIEESNDSHRGKASEPETTMLVSFVNNRHRTQSTQNNSPTTCSVPPTPKDDHPSSEERKEMCLWDEKWRRCEFLQGLILSSVFDDDFI